MHMRSIAPWMIALVASAVVASQASAAMTLTLQPTNGVTSFAGGITSLQLVLTGSRPAVVASIELEFTLSAGAQFVTQSPSTDGFAESAVTSTGGALDTVTDGSLLDGDYFLGFAAGTSSLGIAIGSDNQVLGTLWVQTAAGITADYHIDFDYVDILDSSLPPIDLPVATSGIDLHAVGS